MIKKMTGETPEVRSDKRRRGERGKKRRKRRKRRQIIKNRGTSWNIMEHHGTSWIIMELRIENRTQIDND